MRAEQAGFNFTENSGLCRGIRGETKAVFVKSAASAWRGRIDDISSMLNDVKDASELKRILEDVLEDTQAVMMHNRNLENALCLSSHAMEQMQRDLEKIRHESLTDELTGLPNRRAFALEISRIANECDSGGAGFSLLMIDIDHFKTFNDRYGHPFGDHVLRIVSGTLTDGIKGRDIACRYGGEEFAVILPGTGLQAAAMVGNALRHSVSAKDIGRRADDQKMNRLTISAGVAEFAGKEKIDDLIKRADTALYTAKNTGRDCVVPAMGHS